MSLASSFASLPAAAARAAPRAARRLAALALFRACLRSARRCPAFDQRETMRLYARGRFRDARAERDPARVAHLLAEGAAELATMESYHAAREAKLRAAQGGARRQREALGVMEEEGEGLLGGAGGSVESGGGYGGGGSGGVGSGNGGGGGGASGRGAGGIAGEAAEQRTHPLLLASSLPPPATGSPAPASLLELLDGLGALLGALDERALGAAPRRALQALSLRVDGAAAALGGGGSSAAAAAAAALLEAQAAQRELQRLLLALREEDGGGGGGGAGGEQALAPLSLRLRRLQWALRAAAAAPAADKG